MSRVNRSSKVVVGSTSGAIAGGPSCVPASIAPRCSDEELGGEAVGDDLAVGERLGAGDVIEVPVAQDDPDPAHAEPLERLRIVRARSTETCVS